LAQGKLDAAIDAYTTGVWVSTYPEGHINTFVEAVDARFGEAGDDILPIIRKHLFRSGGVSGRFVDMVRPSPEELAMMTPIEPNRPAAICLSNRAAVHLKAGRVGEAEADAREAIARCPVYAKGYYRLSQCLLQQPKGGKEEASRIQVQVKQFTTLQEMSKLVMWDGMAAVMVGWVPFPEFTMHYVKVRGLKYWAKIRADEPLGAVSVTPFLPSFHAVGVTLLFSLVPIANGQWLQYAVQLTTTDFEVAKVEGMDMIALDAQGGDQLELPPHGHPTATTKMLAPGFIAQMTGEAEEDHKVKVVAISLGQGLTELKGMVEEAMVAMNLPLHRIRVQLSSSTQHGPVSGGGIGGFGGHIGGLLGGL